MTILCIKKGDFKEKNAAQRQYELTVTLHLSDVFFSILFSKLVELSELSHRQGEVSQLSQSIEIINTHSIRE